ncbi:MAG: Tetratricopeptide 2 repeat protein [Pedosphaera sp.]|nr:Tetratricopeptide 2 repeat protein [Pedosphaera sp.]
MVWAVSSVLLAGCVASSPQHAGRGSRGQSADASQDGAAVSAPSSSSGTLDEKKIAAHAHYAQAAIYDMDEEPELALEEYSKAALDDPSNEDLVLELTRRYLQGKQPEKALDLLIKATAVPDASGGLFARLGLVYSRLGKDDKAIEATQTAIKRAPQSLTGYQNLFVIHLQKGKPQEALKDLERASKAPNTSPEFLVELAALYANLERQAPSLKASVNANALAILNRVSKLKPVNPRVNLKLADGYNLMGDTTNATRVYVQLIEQCADLPALRGDIRAKLADLYLRGHDSKKAAEQLEAMVREDPANAQAYYALGGIAYEDKKLPEAVDYFQKTVLLSEDFEQAYYDLAGAQINLDKPKDALATLAKVRAQFAAGFLVEFLSGLAYSREKDFTNAISHFTSAEIHARASEPNRLNGFFYFELGSAYERQGSFDEAERYFEKSLELSPDFAGAMNYLGYMLADRGMKLEKAHELIQKAVKLEPKNPAYLDSLGWVLFKQEKPQEALPQIQKAIELTEEADATLYDHLGDVYAALKQTDKAREAWRKSLAVEPNDAIRKKLDQAADKSTP